MNGSAPMFRYRKARSPSHRNPGAGLPYEWGQTWAGERGAFGNCPEQGRAQDMRVPEIFRRVSGTGMGWGESKGGAVLGASPIALWVWQKV